MTGPRAWGLDDVEAFMAGAAPFVPRTEVTATRLDRAHDWCSTSGSLLHARAGDWLLSDGEATWTVAPEVFRATYEAVGDGRFRKVAMVRARRLGEAVLVPTLEGASLGRAGDWVVQNPAGDAWPVPDEEFGRRYVEAGPGTGEESDPG